MKKRITEVISTGRQWLILAFTVGRMLLAIGMVAHIMACIWYGLGKALFVMPACDKSYVTGSYTLRCR